MHIKETINFLQGLGFIINYEKSLLVASQKCKYLGFIINSVDFTLNLTDKKKNQIIEFANEFKKGNSYKIRKFAKFLGILTAVAYGFIHCKRLERQQFLALKFNGDWGCYCNDISTFGFWNEKEKKRHINYLELLAAFFALKCFASNLSQSEVLLRLDNTTAISYVNRAGGVQLFNLMNLPGNLEMRQDPSISPPPFTGGRQIIRTAFLRKGISEDSVDVMIDSITKSLKQYECNLKCWWDYTHTKRLDIFNSNTSDIIEFFNSRYKKGAKYSVFKQKPTKPKYNTTWDITPVLNYIEKLHPLKQLKLKVAAEKVVTFLALTTAQRLQTLALINIENISISNSGISIKITEQIKTSKPGGFQPELILPFYKDKPGLLSAQTIGHWIKTLLDKAGIDIKQFTAYSTRHAAVSTAHKTGVDIDTIRRSAEWAPGSQTFFKFYNRPIQAPNDQFARAILH
ncbi:uncharacterized protein [Polyergus mexicanus]|uniref:uncharacterized protein n=1 Tax=Polyergus mexicanus TaxID=615972 RepID=UPI0038B58354